MFTSRQLFPKFVMKVPFLLILLENYLKPSFVFTSPLLPPARYFCTSNVPLSKRLFSPSVCNPPSSSCELVTNHELPGAQASIAKKAPDGPGSSKTDSGGGILPGETQPGPLLVSIWTHFNRDMKNRITHLGWYSSNQWSLVFQQLHRVWLNSGASSWAQM